MVIIYIYKMTNFKQILYITIIITILQIIIYKKKTYINE